MKISFYVIVWLLCNWAYCERSWCCDCCCCCKGKSVGENGNDERGSGEKRGGEKRGGRKWKRVFHKCNLKLVEEVEVNKIKIALDGCEIKFDKMQKLLDSVLGMRLNQESCVKSIIEWDNNNCAFASRLQIQICCNPYFVVFFDLLKKLKFPDLPPVMRSVCDFVETCVENPDFDTYNCVSCMNILNAIAGYVDGTYNDEDIKGKIESKHKYDDDENDLGVYYTAKRIRRGFKYNTFYVFLFCPVFLEEFRKYVGGVDDDDEIMNRIDGIIAMIEERTMSIGKIVDCGNDGYNFIVTKEHDDRFSKFINDGVVMGKNGSLRSCGGFVACVYEYHFFAVVYDRTERAWYNYDSLGECKNCKKMTKDEIKKLACDMTRAEFYCGTAYRYMSYVDVFG